MKLAFPINFNNINNMSLHAKWQESGVQVLQLSEGQSHENAQDQDLGRRFLYIQFE